jgi:hypothetical protein
MRIVFEMSGGYGGLFAKRPLSYRVDTDELPEPARNTLLALIRSCGILDLQQEERGSGIPSRPDVYHYTLSLSEKGTVTSLTFDDVSAPPAVRPLLQYLQERAVEERMQGT